MNSYTWSYTYIYNIEFSLQNVQSNASRHSSIAIPWIDHFVYLFYILARAPFIVIVILVTSPIQKIISSFIVGSIFESSIGTEVICKHQESLFVPNIAVALVSLALANSTSSKLTWYRLQLV